MATVAESGQIEQVDVPVEIVPTTRRYHITGFAALNIPNVRRLGGDWHEGGWFGVEPARLSSYNLTDEATYGRLLDRLGTSGLRDARRGLGMMRHPAADWPEKVWAATHERAVVEWAWGRLQRETGNGLPPGFPPVDRYDFCRMLPYPDQWLRVRWWSWLLEEALTAAELAAWEAWRKEWWP